MVGWSCCLVDSSRQCHLTNSLVRTQDGCERMGDGRELEGCSEGAAAADDGPMGGRKDAVVFGVDIKGGEKIWQPLWPSGRFRHGEMKMAKQAREAGERKERPLTLCDLNFYLRKL